MRFFVGIVLIRFVGNNNFKGYYFFGSCNLSFCLDFVKIRKEVLFEMVLVVLGKGYKE